MRYTLSTLLVAIMAAGNGVACDNNDDGSAPAAGASNSTGEQDVLPASLALSSAPEGARSVNEVRASASDGETVVVRGVVGGREEPIAENRAILTLLDESVQTCDRMEMDDGCKTPWDACCVPQETIAASSATIQVVDAAGRPLRTTLRGIEGVEPLARVVVVGKYRPSADGGAVVIEATGVFVEG